MNRIYSGILGLAIGDALGVPYEFCSKERMNRFPATGMIGYGTYNVPAGTWSDDTSLTLATMAGMKNGIDYKAIMNEFSNWLSKGIYTAAGEVFDIGFTTHNAIRNYRKGIDPLLCGGEREEDNGNGSLMRILPASFFIQSKGGFNEENMKYIHNISSLTHRHPLSLVACGIYASIICELMNGTLGKIESVHEGIEKAFDIYKKDDIYIKYIPKFRRLHDILYKPESVDVISSGYVVHTLEASIFSFTTTNSYRECTLRAVNLGEDTDTTAAVAGGMAGIYYGSEKIPAAWKKQLINIDQIKEICKMIKFE